MTEEKKYRFIISKNRIYKKKYNITKKEPTPIDRLKELFQREKEEEKEVTKKKSSLLKTLGIVAVLFLLVFGGLILYIFSAIGGIEYPSYQSEKDMGITIIPLEYGLANINGHNIYTPYITFNVEANKIGRVEYFMESANDPLYSSIYILNSKREQSTRYEEFRDNLKEIMSKDGVSVNEVDLESLRNVPASSSILIIPTGYLPTQLVQEERSIKKLADKGFHIIYIGYDFNTGLMDEDKGRIFPAEYSIDAISNTLGIRSNNGNGVTGLKLKSSGLIYNDVKKEGISINSVYGSIPLIKWNGKGTFMILPGSLDSGWNNGKDAAEDVAKIIRDAPQLKTYGKYIALTTSKKVNVGANNTINDILITEGKEGIKDTYIRLVVRGYNYDSQGREVFETAESYYVYEENVVLGTLFNNRYALSKELSGKLTDLNVNLNEKRTQFPSAVPIFLKIYSSDGEVVLENMFGTSYIIPVEFNFNTQFNPKMPSGTYILKLEDTSDYVFAQSILQVPEIRIETYDGGEPDWKENKFWFKVTSKELGDTNQYTKSLDGTDVIINDKITKKVVLLRGENIYIAEVRVPEGLEEGKEHVFKFTAQDGLEYRGVSTITRQWYEQWWFWAVALAAALPAVGGTLLRPKEKPLYSINIPDFEVRKVNKIKIKKEIFINLFNSINRDYNWKYMPLKLNEIKNGFRKITYLGRPIIIGDYNLTVILDKLKASDEVKNYLDLYILSSWEEESGHDYKYLALFRKVRDRFINLAIPFTNINERDDCDIFVKSYRGEFKFVLGDGDKLYERIIKSLGSKEKVILVFKDNEDKMKFSEKITTTGGGEGIKIAIINGKLIMISFNEIEKYVK